MEKQLKISVIIPCYNQAQFLSETLESVLAQTYSNWECIMVNDGSTDQTEIIATDYCTRDNRFIYYKKSNGGLSSARNAGLAKATGDYIQFLDADDIIHPQKLEIQLDSLCINPADVLVARHNLFIEHTNRSFENIFSENEYDLTLDGFLYKWNVDFVIAIHSGLFSRKFINENSIQFDESLKAREDWFFWCSLALNGAIFSCQNSKLAHYRVHAQSMTNDLNKMLQSLIISAFVVENLIPSEKKNEYRQRISDIILTSISKSFGENINTIRANSIDFKLGFILLYPIHRISGMIKRSVRVFFKRNSR